MATVTETQDISKVLPLLLFHVKGLKYDEEKDVFRFNRKQYKVVSTVQVDNEIEVNFEAVARKAVDTGFVSVTFRNDNPVYDGFNDIIFNRKPPVQPKPEQAPKKTKKEYQKEYYETVTKAKRAEKAKKLVGETREYTCKACGKKFKSAIRTYFCCDDCREENKIRSRKKYYEKYKNTDRYKELRKQIEARRKERRNNDKEYRENYYEAVKKTPSYQEKIKKPSK